MISAITRQRLKFAFGDRIYYPLKVTDESTKWIDLNCVSIAKSILVREGNSNLLPYEVKKRIQQVSNGMRTEYLLNALKGEECLNEWKERALRGTPDGGIDHSLHFFDKTWDAKTADDRQNIKPLKDYILRAPVGLRAEIYLQFLRTIDTDDVLLIGYATREQLSVCPIDETTTYPKRVLPFSELLPPEDVADMLGLIEKLEI